MQAASSVWQLPDLGLFPVGIVPASAEISVRYDARYEPNQPQSDAGSPGPLRGILDTLARHRTKVSEARRRVFGDAPASNAFVDAAAFAKSTDLHLVPLPQINLASDGEINFLWKSESIHIDLGFYGNGKFSYYAEAPGKEPMYGDDLDAAKGMPRELLELFRS